jgi:hypothetical protein
MSAEVFIDTNIFLYSLSDNPDEKLKAERSRQLLLSEKWGLVGSGGRRVLQRCHVGTTTISHITGIGCGFHRELA